MQKIVYKTEEDKFVVLIPFLHGPMTLEEIAEKDVPKGFPYKIVTADEDDFRLYEAWEVDLSEPDGYGGDYGDGTEIGIYNMTDDHIVLTSGETLERKKEKSKKDYSKCKPAFNAEKARLKLHSLRRELRENKMYPYDQIVAQNRPDKEDAEKERVKIREENAALQSQINSLNNIEMMKRLAKRMENGE